jgi:hypothetical protein
VLAEREKIPGAFSPVLVIRDGLGVLALAGVSLMGLTCGFFLIVPIKLIGILDRDVPVFNSSKTDTGTWIGLAIELWGD